MTALPKLRPLASGLKEKLALLPTADYLMRVIESDYIDTPNGKAITLTMQVLEGAFRNRRVWSKLYVEHAVETVANRAVSELADLQAAVGVNGILNDTAQLHEIPFVANVYTRPGSGTFAAKNAAAKFRAAPTVESSEQAEGDT